MSTFYYWVHMTGTDLNTEVQQLREEGRDLSPLEPQLPALQSADFTRDEVRAEFDAFMDAGQALPYRVDPGDEPNDLEAIRAARPASVPLGPVATDLADRIEGAWLGRCAGCLLGKPLEGVRTPIAYPVLERTDNLPLRRYLSVADGWDDVEGYPTEWFRDFLIERIDGAPEDDDTNYTVTALAIVKKYGRNFTTDDVATFWLENIPAFHTCTAERVAYRNLLIGLRPPQTATYRNPYREWIGAQIRADYWGYINPGNPELAAEMAWRDARLSHVRNGIYGEMWAAAMIAAAFTTSDISTILAAGLAQIPRQCRLAAAIRRTMEWHASGVPFEEIPTRLRSLYDEDNWHLWTHTITNAVIVAVGLLYGEGDFALSICRAVEPLYDTDCNGATVGSILGAIHGARQLPPSWIAPLQGTLRTGVDGYHRVPIETLTQQTLQHLPSSN